jgi:hypothetical protein
MVSRVKYLAASLLVLPPLALGACGGGGDDDSSFTSAARGATGQQYPPRSRAGATGATGRTLSPDVRGQGTGKARTGTDGGASVPAATPGKRGGSAPSKKKTSRSSPDGVRYPHFVAKELGRQARVVCSVLSIDSIMKQYEPKSRKPEDIGKAYSARYPPSVRSEVAAGCAEGIRDQQ